MKVKNMVPEVYYRDSRDFAFIGRLIEILLNYMKTGADCVSTSLKSDSANPNTIQLLVNTLGFDSKHEYINKDLIYIASTFCDLLRNKGTGYAIDTAIRLLLNSQNIKNSDSKTFVYGENSDLEIRIPEGLEDIILLEDLFDYILPAGVTYKLTKIANKNIVISSNFTVPNSAKEAITSSNADKAVYVSNAQEIKGEPRIKGFGTIYTGNVYNKMPTSTVSQKAVIKSKSAKPKKGSTPAKLNDKKGDITNDKK